MLHKLHLGSVHRRLHAAYIACAFHRRNDVIMIDTTSDCFRRLLESDPTRTTGSRGSPANGAQAEKCIHCEATWHTSERCPIGTTTTPQLEHARAKRGGCCHSADAG